jgi:hypothetical protein
VVLCVFYCVRIGCDIVVLCVFYCVRIGCDIVVLCIFYCVRIGCDIVVLCIFYCVRIGCDIVVCVCFPLCSHRKKRLDTVTETLSCWNASVLFFNLNPRQIITYDIDITYTTFHDDLDNNLYTR